MIYIYLLQIKSPQNKVSPTTAPSPNTTTFFMSHGKSFTLHTEKSTQFLKI